MELHIKTPRCDKPFEGGFPEDTLEYELASIDFLLFLGRTTPLRWQYVAVPMSFEENI